MAKKRKVVRPTLVVRNVLVSAAGEVLLGLRSDVLMWELPGGKVDDETVLEAAVREQEEETGIALDPKKGCASYGFGDCVHLKDPTRRSVELYLGWRTWGGFASPKEEAHLQWRWFRLSQLPPADRLMPGTRRFCAGVLPGLVKGREEEEGRAALRDEVISLGPVS